jgi:hypothetical protein
VLAQGPPATSPSIVLDENEAGFLGIKCNSGNASLPQKGGRYTPFMEYGLPHKKSLSPVNTLLPTQNALYPAPPIFPPHAR